MKWYIAVFLQVVSVLHVKPLQISATSATVAGGVEGETVSPTGTTNFVIVETVPVEVDIQPTNISIYEGWLSMIKNAKNTIKIAGMYLTLTQGSSYPPSAGGSRGIDIFNALIEAQQRGVDVMIAMNGPQTDPDSKGDIMKLASHGIDVRFVNWAQLLNGSGILHTKFMIADTDSLYIGSANWDWRSISQVKELGAIITQPDLVNDLTKIFNIYWLVANQSQLPPNFPSSYDTLYNLSTPAEINLDGIVSKAFFASSPLPFNTPHRSNDIDAMIWHIDSADRFVYASVMDYAPFTFYEKQPFYWSVLDDAFRRASFKGIKVHLLFSKWPYTLLESIPYMKSLSELPNIVVKLIVIPPYSGGNIPYTRVSHSKYLVTDKSAYITTSNWTPDYFLWTGGVSLNIWENDPQRQILEDIFVRDWVSNYSSPI